MYLWDTEDWLKVAGFCEGGNEPFSSLQVEKFLTG
jgi:hypothetical protein